MCTRGSNLMCTQTVCVTLFCFSPPFSPPFSPLLPTFAGTHTMRTVKCSSRFWRVRCQRTYTPTRYVNLIVY